MAKPIPEPKTRSTRKMSADEASCLRGAISSLPFTGGGIHTPGVLRRFDVRFMPLGREAPTLEDFAALIEGIASAQKKDIN